MSQKGIAHTNDNDLTHSMAHYLLCIHKLKESKGYARVTDIARELNLTKGSVSTAINNLKKKGLVLEEDESKFLVLSKIGHNEVHHILSSRTLLFYFLRDFLEVEENIAEQDSCLMEHLMSQETLEKLFLFMKQISTGALVGKAISTNFDFTQFEDAQDFIKNQKGDRYLEE